MRHAECTAVILITQEVIRNVIEKLSDTSTARINFYSTYCRGFRGSRISIDRRLPQHDAKRTNSTVRSVQYGSNGVRKEAEILHKYGYFNLFSSCEIPLKKSYCACSNSTVHTTWSAWVNMVNIEWIDGWMDGCGGAEYST